MTFMHIEAFKAFYKRRYLLLRKIHLMHCVARGWVHIGTGYKKDTQAFIWDS